MPVCWRRDGALHGPVPGMHINKSHLRGLVLVFRLAPERSPPLEEPLPGASRIPPAAPSLSSRPSPSVSLPAFLLY